MAKIAQWQLLTDHSLKHMFIYKTTFDMHFVTSYSAFIQHS